MAWMDSSCGYGFDGGSVGGLLLLGLLVLSLSLDVDLALVLFLFLAVDEVSVVVLFDWVLLPGPSARGTPSELRYILGRWSESRNDGRNCSRKGPLLSWDN